MENGKGQMKGWKQQTLTEFSQVIAAEVVAYFCIFSIYSSIKVSSGFSWQLLRTKEKIEVTPK